MIVVRPFRPGDARDVDAVASAVVDASAYHVALEPERYELLEHATVAERYRSGRQHPADVRDAERATLVAEVDEVVVGVVDVRVVRPEGSHRPDLYGYVAELSVAERARGRGAGAALLRAAEDWARQRGCRYTVLDYNAHNDAAARFYRERMGYRPAGVIVIREL